MFNATVTLDSMIDDVINRLQGYGINGDQFTTLAADMSPTDTTVTVTDQGRLSQGLIEVGTELMLASSASGVTATVPPWARGYRSTVAEAHTAGERVLMRPTYPRAVVGRSINETITAIYPTLYAVKQVELTSASLGWQYGLPADCERVIRIEESLNGLDNWGTIDEWDIVHGANPTTFPTGVALSLRRAFFTRIRVWYASRPVTFSALTDDWSVTGLPASTRDVIVLGTAVRLIPWLDTGRLPADSVETDALGNARQLGTALSVAGSLKKDYADALARERAALEIAYPLRARGTR